MSDLIQEQDGVLAKPTYAEFGQSNTGKEQCALQFELLEGPDKGRKISAFLYFTQDTNTKRSVESLQYCGCTFPDGDVFNLDGFGTQDVRLVIEHEEWEGKTRAKVKWINSSKPFQQELDAGTKASFRDRMRGFIALAKDKEELPF